MLNLKNNRKTKKIPFTKHFCENLRSNFKRSLKRNKRFTSIVYVFSYFIFVYGHILCIFYIDFNEIFKIKKTH